MFSSYCPGLDADLGLGHSAECERRDANARSHAAGRTQAAEELLPLVYDELRRLPAYKVAQESPGQTLRPTALIHEAWWRLIGDGNKQFAGRGSSLRWRPRPCAASSWNSPGTRWEELSESHLVQATPSDEMLALDEALDLLAAEDSTLADLVKLRHFVGMTMEEAAAALGLPLRTIERLWTYVRDWVS